MCNRFHLQASLGCSINSHTHIHIHINTQGMYLLQIWALQGAAMLLRSRLMRSRKRLPCDVLNTFHTLCSLAHDVTGGDTDSWAQNGSIHTCLWNFFFLKVGGGGGGGGEKLKWRTAVHVFFIPFLLIQPVMLLQLSSPLKNRCRQYLAPREHMVTCNIPLCNKLLIHGCYNTKSVKILTPMSLLKLTSYLGMGLIRRPDAESREVNFLHSVSLCSSMHATKSLKIPPPKLLLEVTFSWGWGSSTDQTQRAEKWIFYVPSCVHPCMPQSPWRFPHTRCF